jgi:organic hydroperoxide reductase OsmC/OhrA
MPVHQFQAHLSWEGSTGDGYRSYNRAHRVRVPPALAELEVTSDAAFLGDPSLLNPEQLLVAAASSCQLLSFLAVAARAGIDVISYTDHARGTMPARAAWVDKVLLRPAIKVRGPAKAEDILVLVTQAHEECFIARSLRSEMTVEAEVAIVPL